MVKRPVFVDCNGNADMATGAKTFVGFEILTPPVKISDQHGHHRGDVKVTCIFIEIWEAFCDSSRVDSSPFEEEDKTSIFDPRSILDISHNIHWCLYVKGYGPNLLNTARAPLMLSFNRIHFLEYYYREGGGTEIGKKPDRARGGGVREIERHHLLPRICVVVASWVKNAKPIVPRPNPALSTPAAISLLKLYAYSYEISCPARDSVIECACPVVLPELDPILPFSNSNSHPGLEMPFPLRGFSSTAPPVPSL
ncbi:hypothetical protein IEQ34_024076 [Dendrobium chrysotoxum]|uniref:Uncharacterized protein n=1 Tax=Dendrobium chrysotoxum TaxID=161865 RepID=A0AAV7FUF7_DENCH|nr:hypothetical protein IEQ34_024076 [Dendrobium chrysotoxum]